MWNLFSKMNINKKQLSLMSLFSFCGLAEAACDYQIVPTDPPHRRTVVCEGTNSPYRLALPTEHTVINQGEIISSSLAEPLQIGSNAVSRNFLGINRGKIIWNNANSVSGYERPKAAANIFYYLTYRPHETTFINEKEAEINVNLDPNPTRSITVMGLGGSGVIEHTRLDNHGKISLNNGGTKFSPMMVGIGAYGKSVNLNNTGDILVNSSVGFLKGIALFGEYSTKDFHINNSGNIIVTPNNHIDSTGIELQAINTSVEKMVIENSGLIRSSTVGLALLRFASSRPVSRIVPRAPIDIRNSGTIEVLEKGFAPISIADYEHTTPIRILNTGKLISHNRDVFVSIATGSGNDQVNNSGNIVGNVYLYKGNDSFSSIGGKIDAEIQMGSGNDKVLLANTDVAKLPLLSGTDRTERTDHREEINSLLLNQSLRGSSSSKGSLNDTRIINWDNISIGTGPYSAKSEYQIGTGDEGRLNLSGDLYPSNRMGKMYIGDRGTLALQVRNAYVDYHTTVAFNGKIDLTEGSNVPNSHLILRGEYEGHAGSILQIKSTWNNPDVQQNDHLTIRGQAKGKTQVLVPNGIIGDVTASEAEKNGGLKSPIVTVEGYHEEMFFHGTAQTTNAGEAQLKKVGNRWFWTLQAVEMGKKSENSEQLGSYETPFPVPSEGMPIYNASVSGYVQLPYINREMGLAQLGRLNQRIGEIKSSTIDKATYSPEEPSMHRQVWTRLNLYSLQLQGASRLGSKVRSGFVQFGRDLRFHYQEGKQSYTGLMASYGWANSRFYDKYRAENGIISADKYVGSAKSELFSLGGYHTVYRPNWIYMDTIGQFSLIKNRHGNMQAHRVSQSGYSISAGVELGKMFKLTEKIGLEPQTQLMYQWLKLDDFHDGYRQVQGANQHSMTARAGARLTWSKEAGSRPNIYFSANLIQQLNGNRSEVEIGREKVSERYARSQAEIGVGGQLALTKKLSIYGDAQYRFSLDGNHTAIYRQSEQSKQSYNARVGVKYSW